MRSAANGMSGGWAIAALWLVSVVRNSSCSGSQI
jgi:hypothetical protein